MRSISNSINTKKENQMKNNSLKILELVVLLTGLVLSSHIVQIYAVKGFFYDSDHLWTAFLFIIIYFGIFNMFASYVEEFVRSWFDMGFHELNELINSEQAEKWIFSTIFVFFIMNPLNLFLDLDTLPTDDFNAFLYYYMMLVFLALCQAQCVFSRYEPQR